MGLFAYVGFVVQTSYNDKIDTAPCLHTTNIFLFLLVFEHHHHVSGMTMEVGGFR